MTASQTAPRHDAEGAGGAIAALAARTGEGDVDAFAALYDRVGPLVHDLAVRRTVDAEALVMDVFQHLWRSAPGVAHDERSVRRWIVLTVDQALGDLQTRHEAAAPLPDGRC